VILPPLVFPILTLRDISARDISARNITPPHRSTQENIVILGRHDIRHNDTQHSKRNTTLSIMKLTITTLGSNDHGQ
jgi:hypothetical protein